MIPACAGLCESGLAPQRLRAALPSETLAPGTESTYNNNQPKGNLSELTKNLLLLAPLSAPPHFCQKRRNENKSGQ
jgi:hypothetical protein